MLVEEFGIDASDGWHVRLADAREEWRRSQVKAAVRDSPEDASRALRELGYVVTSPVPVPEPNHDALRQF